MLQNHFEKIFCINLARRPDRRLQAIAEFDKFNIMPVEFVEAVDGLTLPETNFVSRNGSKVSPAELGCTLSHLKIVKMAKEQKLKNYLVLEDDVEFPPDFNLIFNKLFQTVPLDYHMIYIGGNHEGGYQMVNQHVAKVFRTFTTHAIGIHHTAYDALIKVLGKENDKADMCMASLQSSLNCYSFIPNLAFQRAGFSDILGKNVQYGHLKDKPVRQ